MDYRIKFAQLWTPRFGFSQAGTININAQTVSLSGHKVQGYLMAFLLLPLISGLNRFASLWTGIQVKPIVLVILCSLVCVLLYYGRKSWFEDSVSVEKKLITDVVRNRKTISFCFPDPAGSVRPPAKIFVKAQNEVAAMSLENELRS